MSAASIVELMSVLPLYAGLSTAERTEMAGGLRRIAFADGTQARAAYAAQNGYRWNSALGALRDSGQLQGGATWENFRRWSDARGACPTMRPCWRKSRSTAGVWRSCSMSGCGNWTID